MFLFYFLLSSEGGRVTGLFPFFAGELQDRRFSHCRLSFYVVCILLISIQEGDILNQHHKHIIGLDIPVKTKKLFSSETQTKYKALQFGANGKADKVRFLAFTSV